MSAMFGFSNLGLWASGFWGYSYKLHGLQVLSERVWGTRFQEL